MLREIEIAGRRCFLYADPSARDALIQAVDGHDLEMLEAQIAHIHSLTSRPFSLAAFLTEDWNGALSPWPAPPVFGREGFGGGAQETLDFLTGALLPYVRETLGPERLHASGYSLSGLFALWAGCQIDTFDGVAGVSPSVWFPGWIEYVQSHPIRARRVYLSLGDREERARNPVMARVGDCIRRQRELLQAAGTPCTLEWNPGNHFVDADLRTARGFAWLLEEE